MQKLQRYDTKLSQRFLLPVTSGWWKRIRLVAHLGDGQYVFGGLLVVYLIGWLRHDLLLRQTVLVVAVIQVATFLIVTSIKFIIRRQRPQPPGEFVAFSHDKYSFPSGHSARMAALSLATLFFYPLIGLILIIITLGVALARIAVGVHYFSDVIAGLGIGAVIAFGGVIFIQTIFLA